MTTDPVDGEPGPEARESDDRTPEDATAEAGRAQREPSSVSEFARHSPVVTALIVVNATLLLVVEAAGGSGDIATMLAFGAQPTPLPREQLWRVASSMFLHFGVVHLLFNLWALWIFGPLFERLAGSGRFAALYGASGLAGGAATAAFTGPRTLSAGASGAIFGLLGAFLVLGFRLRHTEQGQSWLRNALLLIGLNVVFGLTAPSIGLVAHLGGLVGGALVFAAEPLAAMPGVPVPPGVRRPQSRLLPAAGAIAAISLVVAWVAAV